LRQSPARVAEFSAAGRAFYLGEGSVDQATQRWTRVLAEIEDGAGSGHVCPA
jgi:hypothetical protein